MLTALSECSSQPDCGVLPSLLLARCLCTVHAVVRGHRLLIILYVYIAQPCCISAGDDACKAVETDDGEPVCVNEASNMDAESGRELQQLLSTQNINAFRDDCPLGDVLDGGASEYASCAIRPVPARVAAAVLWYTVR